MPAVRPVRLDVADFVRGEVARDNLRVDRAPAQILDVDADVTAGGERARDEARAVGEIETQRRFGLRDFRPAPQSAPPPLAGRDAEGASHERARHHAAREKHHPVGIVTIPAVARAVGGLERGLAGRDPRRMLEERRGVHVPDAHVVGARS